MRDLYVAHSGGWGAGAVHAHPRRFRAPTVTRVWGGYPRSGGRGGLTNHSWGVSPWSGTRSSSELRISTSWSTAEFEPGRRTRGGLPVMVGPRPPARRAAWVTGAGSGSDGRHRAARPSRMVVVVWFVVGAEHGQDVACDPAFALPGVRATSGVVMAPLTSARSPKSTLTGSAGTPVRSARRPGARRRCHASSGRSPS